MIPLTLALSLQGRGDYSWFLPLRGEGWERVKYQYYYETVNNIQQNDDRNQINLLSENS